MSKLSLDKDRIGILLLEGVHGAALETLAAAGYRNVESLPQSLSGDALTDRLRDVRFLGIRSRTQITREVLQSAPQLIGIGCFCIGTNQVDVDAAELAGIPVFNAPFSNTRSVAELVLAEIVMLLRGVPQKNAAAHRGEWHKSAAAAFEVRGKKLGIVGYGHIGTQLGLLAEALGMRVSYLDIEHKLPLGNALPAESLQRLFTDSDVISLHVPATRETAGMVGREQLGWMKPGAVLINASRGDVVDLDALEESLDQGRLAGAAIDVFPREPKSNHERFETPLQRFDNVILTPHIGGSTQEAQENIAIEVASKLVRYSDNGTTAGAVNFPQASLPDSLDRRRILHIHRNVPGIMERVNHVFAEHGANIASQYLQTSPAIGYVVMDIEMDDASGLVSELRAVEGTIRARLLH